MIRIRRRIAAATAPAIAVTLALAACGGGVKDSGAKSSAKTGTTGTVSASGTGSTATTTGSTSSSAPAAGTSSASSAVIGTTRSGDGLTFEINALKRTSQNIVELDFTAISDAHADSLSAILGMGLNNGDVGGIKLVDEQGQKEYLSVEDSKGSCLCSSGLNAGSRGFAANTRAQFYVVLTAPPPTVTRIDVVFPIAPPVHNVPISA